jgi:hypothetical protein
MIRLKPGVVLDNTDRHIWEAVAYAAQIWERAGAPDLWITSCRDGVHPGGARPSFHPLGRAVDLRTKNLPVLSRRGSVESLRFILGPDYDVLFESAGKANEHCHVQWDPRV